MKDFDIYAKLMAESFQDDPGIKFQFAGLERGAELFESYCQCQLEAFAKLGCMTTYGDGKGLTIGYFTKDLPMEKLVQCMQESAHYLIEAASPDELRAMQENIQEVVKIAQPDWYMKYREIDNVYVLQVIVVHESLRGTGVFRKLITPILALAESRRTPVVLQTHIREHIAKYQHFGFKLMEEIESDKVALTCYNMMKM